MKLAVISDTHDNMKNLEAAIKTIGKSGADILIHCGDLCSAFVIESLAAFHGPVHIVFGNNEGDPFTIKDISSSFPNITLHGEVAFLHIENTNIAVTHKPEFARGLASTGEYSVVFFGHTHIYEKSKIKDTWLINPGEIMGLREKPGWVLFDTADRSLKHYNL